MSRVKNTFLIMVLTAFCSVSAMAGEAWPNLADRQDPVLQSQLEQKLHKLGLDRAVKRGQLSLALVDITDPAQPRYAGVNGDEMMYAASLPKIAILLGAFKRIEEGQMTLDASTNKELVRMIRHSSNAAATAMLHRVGPAYVASVLKSPEYRLYDTERNGGLWVGKDYGKGGVWKRDPLHHLSHGATAFQVARFYYMLETEQLVSHELTQEMKAVLSKPAIKHKFVKGLKAKHTDAKIFRKSGTWRDFHADSAIVEHEGKRYIAVGLAHSGSGSKWLSQIIVAMDKLVLNSSAPTQVAALN